MNSIETTEVFDAWLAALRDKVAAARVKMRVKRAEFGNFGDSAPIGDGISEMRIHYGPGYRIYFKKAGVKIFILLAGGDKSTQSNDIKTARKMARELEI